MKTNDISGYWTGSISGTNQGGFTLDIKQDGEKVTGIGKFQEPAMGQLGREKTLVLTKGAVEMPSDIFALIYEQMDTGEGWKMRLAKELRAAGFIIDLNKAIS
jgi:hypothetical protein